MDFTKPPMIWKIGIFNELIEFFESIIDTDNQQGLVTRLLTLINIKSRYWNKQQNSALRAYGSIDSYTKSLKPRVPLDMYASQEQFAYGRIEFAYYAKLRQLGDILNTHGIPTQLIWILLNGSGASICAKDSEILNDITFFSVFSRSEANFIKVLHENLDYVRLTPSQAEEIQDSLRFSNTLRINPHFGMNFRGFARISRIGYCDDYHRDVTHDQFIDALTDELFIQPELAIAIGCGSKSASRANSSRASGSVRSDDPYNLRSISRSVGVDQTQLNAMEDI